MLAAIPPLGAEAATLSAERSPDAVATHRPGLAVETGIAAPSGEIPENERRTDTGVVLVLLAGIGSGTAVMWAGAIRRGRRERE